MRQPSASSAAAAAAAKPYKVGLIELLQPRRDSSRVPQQLLNVDVLAKGVRQVEKTLYVYIHADASEPKSNVCEYISSVYARLWDEMLQAENLSLNCIVFGAMAGAGYVSPDDLRLLPVLGVQIYILQEKCRASTASRNEC